MPLCCDNPVNIVNSDQTPGLLHCADHKSCQIFRYKWTLGIPDVLAELVNLNLPSRYSFSWTVSKPYGKLNKYLF